MHCNEPNITYFLYPESVYCQLQTCEHIDKTIVKFESKCFVWNSGHIVSGSMY